MALVEKGESRQEAHEQIRVLSQESSQVVKKEGKDNDLLERLRKTPFFAPVCDQLETMLDPKAFVGRAPQQVEKFTGPSGEVELALRRYASQLKQKENVAADLSV